MVQEGTPPTGEGPGEPDREGIAVEGDGPDVHTEPGEGHPAGDGERGERDIGGPTAPADGPGDADAEEGD